MFYLLDLKVIFASYCFSETDMGCDVRKSQQKAMITGGMKWWQQLTLAEDSPQADIIWRNCGGAAWALRATRRPLCVGLLHNSFANCGVICLYKYLCGFEVMHGDMNCWSSSWLFWTQTETKAPVSVSRNSRNSENWVYVHQSMIEEHRHRLTLPHLTNKQ